ncbi:hypothetical protein E2C01_087277 [Portunus trituberculatus]|uniref:Uncharacterized protein n=1 Tax=Portunus trituberculatus TaxID=210409 RepID=A0A5B7J7Q2_PORTR|nr:hypothetical protein [Portunus trituberculatus]
MATTTCTYTTTTTNNNNNAIDATTYIVFTLSQLVLPHRASLQHHHRHHCHHHHYHHPKLHSSHEITHHSHHTHHTHPAPRQQTPPSRHITPSATPPTHQPLHTSYHHMDAKSGLDTPKIPLGRGRHNEIIGEGQSAKCSGPGMLGHTPPLPPSLPPLPRHHSPANVKDGLGHF